MLTFFFLQVSASIENDSADEIWASMNSSIELECNYVGIPHPEVVWLIDGNQLSPSDNHFIIGTSAKSDLQSTTLRISGLQTGNSGVYSCEVYNGISGLFSSQDRKQFILKVIGLLASSFSLLKKRFCFRCLFVLQ